nr:hypothetical protein [Tanacetum cinerariifolium]
METFSYEYCGGSPHPGFDCQTGNTPVYDQGPCYNQDFGYNQSPFYSPSQPQQFDCYEVCGGPHYSSDCQTKNQLVYEPSPRAPEGSDDYTKVTLKREQCLCDHYTAHVKPSSLAYTLPPPFLATMEPLDTFLNGDVVISTILVREIDEFIKSRDALVDIDLSLGEPLVTLSTGDTEINFNPSRDISELERLLADDPVLVPRVFDDPLGNSDSMSRSSETSDHFVELVAEISLDDSIPIGIDDRYYNLEGDILFFEQFLNEDTSFDVTSALLPTDSSSLVLPPPNPGILFDREDLRACF